MGLSLLAPLFLAALAAVAVPIWVHLSARDRRDVVRFPSLRFLTRLPYRQARRQRLRHRLLFALRTLALVLLALAFTRPLFDGGSAAALGGGGRDVVIALDRSYSMAYAGTWQRALAAARDAVSAAPSGSRLSLLSFAEEAAVEVAPGTDPGAVLAALEGLAPGSGGTRFAPALRLAEEILLDSPLAERQVIVVSDLQAAGWDRSADSEAAVLSPGVELLAADLRPPENDSRANVGIAGAAVRQTPDGSKLTVTARLFNRGSEAIEDLPVTLTVEGSAAGTATEDRVDLAAAGGAAVTLGPIDLDQSPGVARATVRLGDDPLAADNVFHLAVVPRNAIAVLLIEAPDGRPEDSLYLRQALTVAAGGPETAGSSSRVEGTPPAPVFDLRVRSATTVRAQDVAAASVVVIHDSPFPTGAAGRALVDRVSGGGGLWVILGSRSRPPDAELAGPERLLPGSWRESADRLDRRGVGLAGIDYRHPVFEIFAGDGDGNLAAPRIYRYRPIDLGDGAIAVARTADGATALAERRAGKGRVLLWGSPFDNRWSDLPVQPVFLPLVHRVCRYLAGERAIAPWHRVGQALDLEALAVAAGIEEAGEQSSGTAIVETPSGRSHEVAPGAALPLEEAGFYQVTLAGRDGDPPWPVAVNVDPAESDLTRLDPQAFIAASTAETAGGAAAPIRRLSREQRERRQGGWWFLLLATLLLLAAESLWSNRSTLRGGGRVLEPPLGKDV